MAVIALMMAVIQLIFAFKKPRVTWYFWGAVIAFSAMLYAIGVFLEYNLPAGRINHFGGVLEFTAHVFLIHCLYGLSFAYLQLDGKRYHQLAGTFHILLLLLLWFTPLIVSDQFVSRHFIGLPRPFVEAALGPLGPFFMLYIAGAALVGILLWLRHKGPERRYHVAYLSGMIFWVVLGIHDGLAVLRFPTYQYIMEYGFLGFSLAVLWVVFDNYSNQVAEDQYRVITEFANDGVLVVQDNKNVFVNPACAGIFGRPVADSTTSELLDAVAEEDRDKLLQYYNDIRQSRVVNTSMTFRVLHNHDEIKHIEIRSNMISYRNRPAILTVMRDVSQRIQEEAVRKEQEEKLVRLKKMESLGLLAGGVAHDLNNVLSGIVSYPELMLLDLPEDSKLHKPLETIRESGLRASAIVQDLLTVARGIAVPKEPVNLNTVIRAYLTSPEYQRLLHYHPMVTIKSELDLQLLSIKGSTAHIRKVIMNLVSNAAEAIEARGVVTISTTNRYLDQPIAGYENINVGEYAILSVCDTGPGISEEDLKRIFEPFYTKKMMGRSGTGLGLTVVWNVIQDHEGYIDVTSSELGSKFDIFLPITREAVIGKKTSETLTDLKGKGEKILVIDDVKSQREITCMMLEALGYSAFAVESGEAAVRYLQEHHIDLLILDMIMDPGMNGRDTYEQIIKIYPGQKAILVSGYVQTDLVAETLKMGAGLFLKKPLILNELGRGVRNILKQ